MKILTENPNDPDNYNFVVNGDIRGWVPVSQADRDQRVIDETDNTTQLVISEAKRNREAKEALITHAIREQQKALLGKEILEKIESGELASQADVVVAVEKI